MFFDKFKKAETQVWVLIIFSVTIIIATWFLATISFFYKKYLENKKYVSILWNIHSSSSNLHSIWLCIWTDNTKISYDLIKDNYTLNCSWTELWDGIIKARKNLKVISWCKKIDTICVYSIKR